MHFIKNTTIVGLLLSIHVAFAGMMGGAIGGYDGFYLGADVGITSLLDKTSTLVVPETHHMGSTGTIGGGFIGYDYSVTDSLKLALEAFGNAAAINTSVQHYNTNSEYTVDSNYYFGLRLLPGFEFVSGSVVHVILGYSNQQFQITDNGAYGYINKSLHKSGFQSGLGLTAAITQSLFLRLDGIYTTFAAESSRGISRDNPNQYQYYTNDFSMLEAEVSLVYRFN